MVVNIEPPVIWEPSKWLPPVKPETFSEGVLVYRGCTYVSEVGYRPIDLDLYVPRSQSATPLVIYVHGGGWVFGDRRYLPETLEFEELFKAFCESGVAVATIDYRFAKEATYPAALYDIKAAIRYLRKFSDIFKIDPDKFGIMGESAGGHLAAMAALTHLDPDWSGSSGIIGPTEKLDFCIDWYGISDLTESLPKMYSDEQLKEYSKLIPEWSVEGIEKIFLGEAFSNLEWRKVVSPAYSITQNAPEFFIQHGDKDGVVPLLHSEKLHTALKEVGVKSTFEVVEGADHIWQNKSRDEIKAIINRAVSFAVEKFK